MRISAIIFCLIWFAVSIAWIMSSPDSYEPYGSAIGAIVALISSFFLKKAEVGNAQNQTVSGKSFGIQAGRDVKIKNLDQN
jgi:hypothetical protein